MKSDQDRAVALIEASQTIDRLSFLARLIYELTLAGRTSYSPDSAGLDNPTLLREINEIQHQLAAQLMQLITDGHHSLPPSTLVSLFLGRQSP